MSNRANQADRVSGAFIAGAFAGALGVIAGAASAGYFPGTPDCAKIGETCSDGTIYAGASPKTGARMFVRSADAHEPLTWDDAAEYANTLAANGHDDWRLPTVAELKVIFGISGRNQQHVAFAGWHWTSEEASDAFAWRVLADDIYAMQTTLATRSTGAYAVPVRSGP